MLTVALAMLATYRLTLLVTADELTKGPREWLVRRFEAARMNKVAFLLECPWCASMWVAMPVCASGWRWGSSGWWFVPAWVLAASAVTGVLATFAAPGE